MGNPLITFDKGIDARCRIPARPTVARFNLSNGAYRFIVIGTQYGYLRTTGGDVRTWRTYSGARRSALRYVSLWGAAA